MDLGFLSIVLVVTIALAFDFTNGFHDTANAMATTVVTNALPPRVAVGLAAVLNFAGAFISLEVANTIAEGVVSAAEITLGVVFAALVGAIGWNLATWYLGLPSSSSHALIGGVVGATLVGSGAGAVDVRSVLTEIAVPTIVAPLLAGIAAAAFTFLVYKLLRSSRGGDSERVRHGFRWGQVASGSLVALAHGTNDAQKTMGVITLALVANGNLPDGKFEVPTWVVFSAATAISLGTYMGGWRIIRTVGRRVTDVKPPQGFSAEATSASVIFASSALGFPLSTTQVVSGSVAGSGLGRSGTLGSVHWGVVRNIAVAWLLTLPGAATLAAVATAGVGVLGDTSGTLAVTVALMVGAGALWLAARRAPVTPGNVTRSGATDMAGQ